MKNIHSDRGEKLACKSASSLFNYCVETPNIFHTGESKDALYILFRANAWQKDCMKATI